MAKESMPQKTAVLNLYKKRSDTPLQTIERYVASHPEFKGSKMTYAGRLDPMAEGVLVVLSGDKNKEREAYTGLDKDYDFEFVLGVDTDTHDVLGLVTSSKPPSGDEEAVKAALGGYKGTFTQKYPAYSSKVVDGTPLHELAREGKIGTIVLPEHEVVVSRMEYLGSRTVSRDELQKFIRETVTAVRGDFRQREIHKHWEAFFASSPETFVVYKARVSCGSGFYVRQLVSDIGENLGTGATTLSILRTRVGEFRLEDSIR